MTPKRRLLQIPPGTEGFYLEEAFRHRRIVGELDRLLTGWGYLPAETPVFDFYDIYKPLMDETAGEQVYRLMGREGDLLLLRNDVTLFLAKQMGMALTSEDLPVRVWYADSILRHQQQEDISKNEFYQLGAELIGLPGIEGDSEILFLVGEILQFFELEAVLHLGSAALVHRAAAGLGSESTKAFFSAVALHDYEALGRLAEEIEGADSGLYEELFSFIGKLDEFNTFVAGIENRLPDSFSDALSHLSRVARMAENAGTAGSLRIDLSETGSQAYHTGIVFQAYLEGVDSAFLSGGRYDKLLHVFGFDSPSVGFSLLLRKIEPLIGNSGRFSPPLQAEKARGETLLEKYKDAAAKRAQGRIVCL